MPVRNKAVPILIFIISLVLTGCGTDKTVTTPHPAAGARFAVVANSLSDSISSYTIDPQTGLLSPQRDRADWRRIIKSHCDGTLGTIRLRRQYSFE